jgi:MFS transporter, NNP family, nitrate/nitrite transporter
MKNPQATCLAEDSSSISFHSRLMPLFFLAGIFFLNFLSRIILAPLLISVERELQLSHGAAGGLFLLISLGYCVTLGGSGFLSSRISHRSTITSSALALGAALLAVSLSQGLFGIRLGLVGVGLATGFYLPSGIATITNLVPPRHWGKAVAIHELAPNLGFVVAPLLAEAVITSYSWRVVLVLLAVASLLMGAIFARFGTGGAFTGEAPSPSTLRLLIGRPSLWIMTVLFSLAIASSMGVYAMIPLYLVTERGLELGWTNSLVAMSRVAALLTALLGGWLVDRMGKRRAMGGALFATGVLTALLGVAPGSWIVLIVFLQPMVAVCFFPAGFAAISRLSSERMRNVAVSLVIPTGILVGAGLVPTVLGLLGEQQRFYFGFVLMGALMCASVGLLTLLHFPEEAPPCPPPRSGK